MKDDEKSTDQPWYQQPIAWLGLLVFVTSMAGCIHLIMLAVQYEDPALPAASADKAFKIPSARTPQDAPARAPQPQP